MFFFVNFLVKGGISLDLLFSLILFVCFCVIFLLKGGISLDFLKLVFR